MEMVIYKIQFWTNLVLALWITLALSPLLFLVEKYGPAFLGGVATILVKRNLAHPLQVMKAMDLMLFSLMRVQLVTVWELE